MKPIPASLRKSAIDTALLVCMAICFFRIDVSRRGNTPQSVLSSDVAGYYVYLPSIFVYDNIHSMPDKDFMGRIKNEKGEGYTKYTCGIAYCYLPFFLFAHAWAHLTHTDANGFSTPYSYAIMVCGAVWVLLGLFLLRNLLLRHFTRSVTWITLISIVFATNYFNYASLDVGMSHIYNFALFTGGVLAIDQYYKTPRKSLAILIGTLMAWVILARPSNVTMVIFLVLYRTTTIAELKARMHFLRLHAGHLFLVVSPALLIILPQLLYWHEMTGHWIIYSYGGEGFTNWNKPQVASVLFDTQYGLFLYSPALLFMFWSLFVKRKDPRTNTLAIAVLFPVITYIFASWWAWGFGGAYGHRCYVDFLPAFAFPVAVTFESVINARNVIVKTVPVLLLALFCYYTVGLCTRYYAVRGFFDGPQWSWNFTTWADEVKRLF